MVESFEVSRSTSIFFGVAFGLGVGNKVYGKF